MAPRECELLLLRSCPQRHIEDDTSSWLAGSEFVEEVVGKNHKSPLRCLGVECPPLLLCERDAGNLRKSKAFVLWAVSRFLRELRSECVLVYNSLESDCGVVMMVVAPNSLALDDPGDISTRDRDVSR